MKTIEARGEIMDNIIFALLKADIIGHRRTLEDIRGHLCEKRLTVCA